MSIGPFVPPPVGDTYSVGEICLGIVLSPFILALWLCALPTSIKRR